MRRLLVITVFLTASVLGQGPFAGASEPCPQRRCPTTTRGGYHYLYVNGVFYGVATSGTGTDSKGHPLELFYQAVCAGNNYVDENGNGKDLICHSALVACPPPAVMMWIFQRPAGSHTVPVRRPESQCIGAPKTISLADAQAAFLRYMRDKRLPVPTVATAPPTGGLVNLPQIFSTADSPVVTLDVTEPLPATLTAEPHYGWDFGDGAHGPDEPGTPYQAGVYPADHPGYYLEHTYAATGPATVTVTMTWKGTFTVAGIPDVFPLPDVVFTASRTLNLRQAKSELVAEN